MTKDKARKRNTRARAAERGDSYTYAHRTDPKAARDRVDDVAPAEVPEPVAVMMARQLHAALLHVGAWRGLVERQRILPRALGVSTDEPVPGPTAPLHQAERSISRQLLDLRTWSERTAQASGVITELPAKALTVNQDAQHAERILYPEPSDQPGTRGWCVDAGGHLPQPGDAHVGWNPETAPRRVRHSLPGPVPDWQLTDTAEGRKVRKASDIVPGTPAQPVWDAVRELSAYRSGWMDRDGDSPADLAAALDGLAHVAEGLVGAVEAVTEQIHQRHRRGALRLAQAERFDDAHERWRATTEDRADRIYRLTHAIHEMRTALTGARAELPAEDDWRQPRAAARLRRLATEYDGRSAADIRAALGKERFVHRQIERVGPANDTRAQCLRRMLDWMHTTGANTYSAARHLAAEGVPID